MKELNSTLNKILTFHYGEQMHGRLFLIVFLIAMVVNCITSPPPPFFFVIYSFHLFPNLLWLSNYFLFIL